MTLQDRMLAEQKILENQIRSLEEKIKSFPPGTLTFRKNGKRYKYYHQFSDNTSGSKFRRVYIKKKDRTLLFPLAEKIICRKKLADAKRNLHAVKAYLAVVSASSKDHVYERLRFCDDFRDLFCSYSVTLSDELRLWQSSEYEKNPDYPETLVVDAIGNQKVRSKSESSIAFVLHENGIPYRYEAAFSVNGHTIYPDFTIRHPETGKQIIWEHFGMMDDSTYAYNATFKIRTYIEAGLIPDQDLIMTFESSERPFTVEKAQFVVKHKIL
ncbi:MAG: hypothetical protein J6N77_04390 [Lachnospiraceae bacterium]|nr:hypothetical protein [Lachnospiraceae bacterium]